MSKQIKLSDLPGRVTLELHDCEIIANAINVFGSGQHPVADAQNNLDYFDLDYLLDCLDKGIFASTSEEFKEEVTDLYVNIHAAKEDEEGRRKIKADLAADEEDYQTAIVELTDEDRERLSGPPPLRNDS